jgi:hypothetical protein
MMGQGRTLPVEEGFLFFLFQKPVFTIAFPVEIPERNDYNVSISEKNQHFSKEVTVTV